VLRALVVAAIAGALSTVSAAACGSGPAAPTAAPAVLPQGTTFAVAGHGWGHGHGMSQYGARGAAARGLNAHQILRFYYPGTRVGHSAGRISVLITEDTTRDVVVQARSGLQAQIAGGSRHWTLVKLRPKATRWRIVPDGQRSQLQFRTKGPWRNVINPRGRLQFAAGNQPIRLYMPHGSVQYRGVLRSVPGSRNGDTVNIVSMEQYVRGVVPREMPATWRPAAVRSQAVAARTYATYERAHAAGGRICDTASCQVYGGYSAEESASNAAVAATAHQILTWKGQAAFTQFSSSNGGYMLAGSEPYLVSKKDPYEKYGDNPYESWTGKLTLRQFERRWPSAGPIVSVTVHRGSTHRYVDHVTVAGRNRVYQVSADAFRSWAGLRSTWFGITTK
jgi:stage II sporulation protein D